MCARHPRGFRRLARFAPRVSEVLPGLRGPVYAHRLFACRTRIMAESPCQGKSDSTYGPINMIGTGMHGWSAASDTNLADHMQLPGIVKEVIIFVDSEQDGTTRRRIMDMAATSGV